MSKKKKKKKVKVYKPSRKKIDGLTPIEMEALCGKLSLNNYKNITFVKTFTVK